MGRREKECGTTACLAGWALLLSGYTLPPWDGYRNQRYRRPDGTVVTLDGIAAEAAELLALTNDTYYGPDRDHGHWLLTEPDEDTAITRFRTLVQAAEPGTPPAGGETDGTRVKPARSR